MVDPLTISLVDSLLRVVLVCEVQLSCSALTEPLMPLFTIHGSRQATETKSHGQAAIRKSFSSPGSQEGKCRLNSFQPALLIFFLIFLIFLPLNATTELLFRQLGLGT